ncbi:MAG: methyltransferase domain-containing protein [Candidatus Jordarchaeales archaeon]
MKTRFFFLLSGENEKLSQGELKAILEASGLPFSFSASGRVAIVETDYRVAQLILERSAMCHYGCLLVAESPPSLNLLFDALSSSPINSIVSPTDSFAVRAKPVNPLPYEVDTMLLERTLGEFVKKMTDARVNLKNPNKLLVCLLTEKEFLFGLCIGRSARKSFRLRPTRYRPFMTSSSMSPFTARTMVNLARALSGHILLDPFCGSGSILIEAALIGCRVVGGDIDPRMVRGAKANFNYYQIDGDLLIGDARYLPFSSVDRVVTDPPYGRAASTKGVPLDVLLQHFLSSMSSVLKKGGWLCMACPSNVNVERYMDVHDFKIVETYQVRVHGGLTRKIVVSKR